MDIKKLIAVATGEIHHINNGLRPDFQTSPDSRDDECPACKILTDAAAEHDDLERRLREAEGRLHDVATHCANVEFALREVRESLQFANDSPGGPITDTIWMMHRPETLFDFIDSTLQPPKNED